jgi:hypothetical protein
MADKVPKGKSVLGTLPAKRPARLGAPRNGTAAAKRKPAAPKLAAKQRPRAVRPASPPLQAHRLKPPPRPLGAPTGAELVTTAIRATGELAQIGFVLGGKALKRAVDRLPRPGS